MQERNAIEEVHRICQKVKSLIDVVQCSPVRKAALKAFFLAVQVRSPLSSFLSLPFTICCLQVCHMLMFGKVKDAKECLKLLQSCFQTISSSESGVQCPLASQVCHW